jgi:flagellar basal-body rod protein FlgB
MQPVSLFDLAARQAQWLSVRQSAIAGNIANVNTPGYRPVDAKPFELVLGGRTMAIAPLREGHFPIETSRSYQLREDKSAAADGAVTYEQEMVKAGEVRRGLELNTAIVKAFHRMIVAVSRS